MTGLYVRVSTQEQAKDGYSIEEQTERLKAYARAMNWTCRTYVDAGCSGSTMDRPALQEMIRDIQDGRLDMVAVYKLDRLSRSQKDTLHLIEDVFLSNDVDFVSMTENFDTSSPFGRAMIGILSVFAQLEREQIKERMTLGRTGRAKEGKYHGGPTPPVGYDYHDGQLIINEFEAVQIREIYSMYLSGMSIRKIGEALQAKGFQHKGGKWIDETIRKVLTSDVYIGRVRFDGQSYQGIHEPIIDQETFDRAQRLWSSRKANRSSACQSSLLGGLLFCSQCHARYGVSQHSWNGRKYRYYACYSRTKAHRSMITNPDCKNKTWRMEELDQIILDEIRKLSISPESLCEALEDRRSSDTSEKEKALREHLRRLGEQKQRLMALYGLGEFTIEELQAQVLPINEQMQALDDTIKAMTAGMASVQEAQEMISGFADVISRGSPEEIRLLVTSLIRRIELDGEDITIHWSFL